eukprot:Skav222981  [mRNA]  locus=scaffold1827:100473:101555:+ [translate_table: standard]
MTATEFEGILDHYAVLGLDHGCSSAEVRKAFRAKALRWHPDKAGSSAEARRRFQEATDAYEVLGDEEKRKLYDAQLQQEKLAAAAAEKLAAEKAAWARAQAAQAAHAAASPKQGYPRNHGSPQAAHFPFPHQSHGVPGRPTPTHQHSRPFDEANRQHGHNGHTPQADLRPTAAEVHGYGRQPEEGHRRRNPAGHGHMAQGHDTRPTAAELNPNGFGQPFRATVSDLRTLASFTHEGSLWIPKVKDVKWCRPGDAGRVQLTYIADYTSSRSRGGGRGAGLLQLLQTSNCDALQTSFQEHLDKVASRCSYRHFRMQLRDHLGGELQFRVKLCLEGETNDLLRSFDMAWELAPSQKMKDCPLM